MTAHVIWYWVEALTYLLVGALLAYSAVRYAKQPRRRPENQRDRR